MQFADLWGLGGGLGLGWREEQPRGARARGLRPNAAGQEEADDDRSGGKFSDMAAGVITAIQERDLKDTVLVGHSGVGPVTQLVADRLAERGGAGGAGLKAEGMLLSRIAALEQTERGVA